jgi:hypothetical protein
LSFMRVSVKLTTGFADPRVDETAFDTGQEHSSSLHYALCRKTFPGMVRRTADPSASPGFLLKLVALANFMRLSLLKGAHVALSCAAWQEIRVRSG